MKKHLFLLAVGALALTACTSEDVIDDVAKKRNAITFETAVTKTSRAEDLTMSNLRQFNVFGFYTMPDNEKHANPLFSNVPVTNEDGRGIWTYDAKYLHYWVPGAKFYFYAYSCGSVSQLSESFGNFSLEVSNEPNNGEGLDPSERVLEIDDYLCDYTHQHDLICAAQTEIIGKPEGSNNDPVSFEFKHVLSKVEAAFTNNFNAEYDVVIRDVSIRSIWNQGDFNFATGWKNVGYDKVNAAPLVYLLDTEGVGGPRVEPIKATQTMDGDKKVPAVTNFAYVIPAKYDGDNKAYINFTIDLMMGDDKVMTKVLTATIQPEWKTGYAYRYNIEVSASTVSMQEITFNVSSVSSWNTNDNTDVTPIDR